MKLVKHPEDYPSSLSPAYRRFLAASDNVATGIILGCIGGFLIVLAALVYFHLI